jgi:hypothetical protein
MIEFDWLVARHSYPPAASQVNAHFVGTPLQQSDKAQTVRNVLTVATPSYSLLLQLIHNNDRRRVSLPQLKGYRITTTSVNTINEALALH